MAEHRILTRVPSHEVINADLVVEVRHDGDEHLCKVLQELGRDLDLDDGVGRVEMLPERALVYTDEGDVTADRLSRAGVSVHRLYVRRSTLEDVFLRLSGRTLVD